MSIRNSPKAKADFDSLVTQSETKPCAVKPRSYKISAVRSHPNPTVILLDPRTLIPLGQFQSPPTIYTQAPFHSCFIFFLFPSLSPSCLCDSALICPSNQWRVGAKLSDLELPRRPRLGVARPASSSLLVVSPGS